MMARILIESLAKSIHRANKWHSSNFSNPYSADRAQGSNRQPTRSNTMALTSKPHRSMRTTNTAAPATSAAKVEEVNRIQFIRADQIADYLAAVDQSITKAKQIINEQGKSYWIRESCRLGFIELKVVMNDFMFRVSLLMSPKVASEY
jgi:hypothetical protein